MRDLCPPPNPCDLPPPPRPTTCSLDGGINGYKSSWFGIWPRGAYAYGWGAFSCSPDPNSVAMALKLKNSTGVDGAGGCTDTAACGAVTNEAHGPWEPGVTFFLLDIEAAADMQTNVGEMHATSGPWYP